MSAPAGENSPRGAGFRDDAARRVALAPARRKLNEPRLVPLTPELYRFAVLEERDPLTAEMAEAPHVEQVRVNAWAGALLGQGRVIGAGGLVPVWTGRATCWLLVSREARARDIVAGLRRARQWLDKRQRDPFFRRIEAEVRWDAPWRASFMAALGFALEGRMRRWDPLGRDYGLYARVALEERDRAPTSIARGGVADAP